MHYALRAMKFSSHPGEVIRERRLELGMSTVDLAARAGISLRALGYIERGESWPRLDNAARIAAALGVAVDALIPEAAS